jgi:hypothetical protein
VDSAIVLRLRPLAVVCPRCINRAEVDRAAGFESDNGDRDFKAVVERGAVVLEPPTDKEWGVRTANFKGQAN